MYAEVIGGRPGTCLPTTPPATPTRRAGCARSARSAPWPPASGSRPATPSSRWRLQRQQAQVRRRLRRHAGQPQAPWPTPRPPSIPGSTLRRRAPRRRQRRVSGLSGGEPGVRRLPQPQQPGSRSSDGSLWPASNLSDPACRAWVPGPGGAAVGSTSAGGGARAAGAHQPGSASRRRSPQTQPPLAPPSPARLPPPPRQPAAQTASWRDLPDEMNRQLRSATAAAAGRAARQSGGDRRPNG